MIEIFASAVAVLSFLVAYFSWKAKQFQRPSEITESIKAGLAVRHFENPGLEFKIVNIFAKKPGFPKRLYKYIPYAKREGYIEIRLRIDVYQRNSIILPKPNEIRRYRLFPPEGIEIRNVTWTDSPVEHAHILLRVHDFNEQYVINGVHAVIVSIVELITGDRDEEFHAQFRHIEINDSNQGWID